MKHFNLLDYIRHFIYTLFHSKKERKENSEQIKKEMCARVRESHTCSYFCEYCAWNHEGNEWANKGTDKHI